MSMYRLIELRKISRGKRGKMQGAPPLRSTFVSPQVQDDANIMIMIILRYLSRVPLTRIEKLEAKSSHLICRLRLS